MQEHLSSAALGKSYRVLLSPLTYFPVGKGYGHCRRTAPCLVAFIAMDGMYAGFAGAKTGISHRKICVQLRNLG